MSQPRVFTVRVTDASILCERPDGILEFVAWNDLQKVELLTTSAGPEEMDVYWILHGSTGGCVIPQDAIGAAEMLKQLQTLPGFDNEGVIKAMSSVGDAKFVCWERKS